MASAHTACLITATTKAAKDVIKGAGGSWVGALDGWVFPEAQRASVVAALISAGVDVSQAAAMSAVPGVQPSINACATLNVKKHKKAILVTGDTLKVKDQVRTSSTASAPLRA